MNFKDTMKGFWGKAVDFWEASDTGRRIVIAGLVLGVIAGALHNMGVF